MDILRHITKEDFLSIKPFSEGGTVLGGRRYAKLSSLSSEKQLELLGKPDKTGEGVCDRVFFFEVFKDVIDESYFGQATLKNASQEPLIDFALVSAVVVDRYKFVSTQEMQKELALIQAKIKRNNEIT